jgi:hypothetical protein
VVLICIPLLPGMVKDFSCFLAIWISSLEKVHLSSVAHFFFIGSLIWGEFRFLSSLYYSGYQSFVWCIVSKYFFPLCGWSLQFREHFWFLISCSPSFLLVAGWWSSTEEVRVYSYCFQGIPCSFMY